MRVPTTLERRLQRIDRNLSLKWDRRMSRWILMRRNPVRPSEPAEKVHVWQTLSKEFLPADVRLVDWILGADLRQKFKGRDERYFGALLDKELREIDEQGEKDRQKEQDDLLAKLYDGLVFMCKNDRRRIKPETVRPY